MVSINFDITVLEQNIETFAISQKDKSKFQVIMKAPPKPCAGSPGNEELSGLVTSSNNSILRFLTLQLTNFGNKKQLSQVGIVAETIYWKWIHIIFLKSYSNGFGALQVLANNI